MYQTKAFSSMLLLMGLLTAFPHKSRAQSVDIKFSPISLNLPASNSPFGWSSPSLNVIFDCRSPSHKAGWSLVLPIIYRTEAYWNSETTDLLLGAMGSYRYKFSAVFAVNVNLGAGFLISRQINQAKDKAMYQYLPTPLVTLGFNYGSEDESVASLGLVAFCRPGMVPLITLPLITFRATLPMASNKSHTTHEKSGA